jgi:hypothetical protein
MADEDDKHDDEKTDEDHEYEYELMTDTADRIADLTMALVHYNDELAKQALALALGTLSAHYDEPCLHQLFDLAEAQMDGVKKHMEEHHNHEHKPEIEDEIAQAVKIKKDDAGNN